MENQTLDRETINLKLARVQSLLEDATDAIMDNEEYGDSEERALRADELLDAILMYVNAVH